MAAKAPLVGIRLKLSAAFTAISLVIAGLVIGAINMQLGTIERAAILEAEDYAKVVAYAGTDNALSDPEYLQRYVDGLHTLHGRDLVFVDSNKRGIADADKSESGMVFSHDPGNEVGQTIRDGRVRTFIERSEQYPKGARQIVVPLRESQANSDSAIIGAAIVEYTQIYDGLLAAVEKDMYLLGGSGIGWVLLSMIFGLRIAAQMARRLKVLQDAADVVAEGDYETKVPVASRDEIGRLGTAFNTMAGALKSNRDELLEYGRGLEKRVASRTEDLTKAVSAMSESEERYRKLFELSPDGMLIHSEGKIALVNGMCMKMLGATAPEQLIGKAVLDIFHPDYREHVAERMRQTQEDNRPALPQERKIVTLDGTAIDVEVAASPFMHLGKPSVQVVMRDITERKKASEQLNYLAQYDSLTGLPNRSLFRDRLGHTLAQAKRSGRSAAVLFVDLDRFKIVNDTRGHAVGDTLLRQAAARLSKCIRADDTVGRFGGDEFGVILLDLPEPSDAAVVANKIIDTIARPFDLDGQRTFITASVGITLYPADATDPEALTSNADAAMYRAKELGRNTYHYFTQEMHDRAMQRMQMEASMHQALERSEFVLHYQPKVSLASGKLTGTEALIRWNDPRTGLVPPVQFIPILEETGLINEVGRWALRQAIENFLRWRTAGLPAVRIAVNVSPLQLRNPDFVAEIKQAIGADGDAAAGLELEITESLIMKDVKHSIAVLEEIRALGVTIAIDDFGTGFSSLSYLSKLPVDTLKIDRSFVIDMTTGPQGLALVSTIINLAHSLKLKVVAEGVETEDQARLLRLLSCDEMQGYLFSKPVSGEIFAARFLAPPPARAALDRAEVLT